MTYLGSEYFRPLSLYGENGAADAQTGANIVIQHVGGGANSTSRFADLINTNPPEITQLQYEEDDVFVLLLSQLANA